LVSQSRGCNRRICRRQGKKKRHTHAKPQRERTNKGVWGKRFQAAGNFVRSGFLIQPGEAGKGRRAEKGRKERGQNRAQAKGATPMP